MLGFTNGLKGAWSSATKSMFPAAAAAKQASAGEMDIGTEKLPKKKANTAAGGGEMEMSDFAPSSRYHSRNPSAADDVSLAATSSRASCSWQDVAHQQEKGETAAAMEARQL